jgi:hypothetical protein
MNLKEIFSDILPIISKFSPVICDAIGGPLGVACEYALPVLAKEFNAHPHNIHDIVQNIINDPQVEEKLISLEKQHGEYLKEKIRQK